MYQYEGAPGSSLSDAINTMTGDSEVCKELRKACRMMLQNRDAWENGFVYEVSLDTNSVIIRSTGKNGRDENGNGDDIQYEAILK
jgi:hypothetical protein